MRTLLIVLALGAAACGGGSDDCSDDMVEVFYFGGARDGNSVCVARPATCDNPASCGDTDCLAAMYALCESPYFGVACAEGVGPPEISCN